MVATYTVYNLDTWRMAGDGFFSDLGPAYPFSQIKTLNATILSPWYQNPKSLSLPSVLQYCSPSMIIIDPLLPDNCCQPSPPPQQSSLSSSSSLRTLSPLFHTRLLLSLLSRLLSMWICHCPRFGRLLLLSLDTSTPPRSSSTPSL